MLGYLWCNASAMAAEQDQEELGLQNDENVQFIQHSPSEAKHHKSNNGSLNDEVCSEGTASPAKGKSTSKLFQYVRYTKTFWLFFSFIGLGASNTLYGPTILDLAYHTKSDLAEMSYVFTARAIGFLVGTIVGGWLFDRYNKYLVLGGASLGMVVTMVVFPLVKSVYALIAIGSAMAFCAAMLDTAGNVILFILWPTNSQPIMQMLHFMYAAGALIAPLLAKPFLLPEHITNLTSNATTISISDDIPSVAYAYWLGTIPCVLAGIFFLVCAFLKSLKDEVVKKEHQRPASNSNNKVFTGIVLALFFVFTCFYVGIEEAYGGFIFSFAVKSKPHMTQDRAALLTATFWGTFAFSRFISVALAKYLKPHSILLMDIIGCIIAGAILVSQHSECNMQSSTQLWVGTVILGISASSIFASIMSWVDTFQTVSGRLTSFLFVGGCVGGMIIPVVVGNTFKSIGPCTLMHCIMALSCLCLLTFAAIYLFGRYYKPSDARNVIEMDEGKLSEGTPKLQEENDENEAL